MDKQVELLPCPFRGGEPTIKKREDECLWSHNIVPWLGVDCVECGFGFDWPDGYDDPNAITQWNTRTTPTPPAGQVEAVTESFEKRITEYEIAVKTFVKADANGIAPCELKIGGFDISSLIYDMHAAIKASGAEHIAGLVRALKNIRINEPCPWVDVLIDETLEALPPELRFANQSKIDSDQSNCETI